MTSYRKITSNIDVYKRQFLNKEREVRTKKLILQGKRVPSNRSLSPVSYTHLDVYKRQVSFNGQTIPAGIGDGVHRDHIFFFNTGSQVSYFSQFEMCIRDSNRRAH